jgi:hypothetical protein
VAIDAEDLLDHHHAAAQLARRVGAIGRELVAVRGGQLDHLPHGLLSP